jgi:plasmid rolling circle replication initiator protein Rep
MDNEIYLSDLSERDRPWDGHRWDCELVAGLYGQNEEFRRYAERMAGCSQFLDFILKSDDLGEIKLKLQEVWFCRVRHCPVCQWRRSLMWRARFYNAVPKIIQAYPSHRFIFLTLTVRNCDLKDLRSTVNLMVESWKRLTKLKDFPALGYVRSLEITRSRLNQAHPHFHCLLMVPGSYFKSRDYLSQVRWTELWQRSMRLDYPPRVDIRSVRSKTGETGGITALQAAIVETLKYSVKPSDLVAGVRLDQAKNLIPDSHVNQSETEWLYELTRQLHKLRATSVGGILRQFVSDSDPEDLIHPEGQELEPVLDDDIHLLFSWREQVKRYAKGN